MALGQTPAQLEARFWHDQRMPYVETRQACQSRVCYQAHSHPTFSIGAVDQGQSQFSSYLSAAQTIQSGSLVCIPAHVEHSCNPMPGQPWSYQMMHLQLDWLSTLLQEITGQALQYLIPQFTPRILNTPQLYAAFTRMNQTLFSLEQTIAEKEQVLIEGLTQILLPAFIWQKTRYSKTEHDKMACLLDYIASHDEILTLAQLAAQVELSRFAVIRLFKHYLGFTPHAYQLNLNIHQAREQLKQGQSILTVAYDLGFSDQSHFHRVFKGHTGVTPKQYQQKFKAAI